MPLRPVLAIPLLLCAVLGFAAETATGPKVVEDFTPDAKRPPVVFPDSGAGTATIAITPAPAGADGNALTVTWTGWTKNYLDFAFGRAADLPLTGGLRGLIQVRVHLPAGTTLHGGGLRLIDAKGEVYQWRATGDLASSGWRTLVFAIDPATSNGHWGGDKNDIPDPPLRLQGFAVSPQPGALAAGSVAIGAITCAGTP